MTDTREKIEEELRLSIAEAEEGLQGLDALIVKTYLEHSPSGVSVGEAVARFRSVIPAFAACGSTFVLAVSSLSEKAWEDDPEVVCCFCGHTLLLSEAHLVDGDSHSCDSCFQQPLD